MSETFHDAFLFLDSTRAAGRKTLVHCFCGINRSAAVVAGYLVEREGVELAQAIRQIVGARGAAFTNRYIGTC